MKPLWKNLAVIVAAFGVGVAGYALFGASPDKLVPPSPGDVEWKPVQARVPDLAAADERWSELAPWGAMPKPVEAPRPPPPPPPVAVGIAKGARGPEAIFMISGAGELRIPPGGRLPDGGRLLRISGMRVTWVDGKGQKQEREMFMAFRPTSAPSDSSSSPGRTASPASNAPLAPQQMPSPPSGARASPHPGRPPPPPGVRPPGQ